MLLMQPALLFPRDTRKIPVEYVQGGLSLRLKNCCARDDFRDTRINYAALRLWETIRKIILGSFTVRGSALSPWSLRRPLRRLYQRDQILLHIPLRITECDWIEHSQAPSAWHRSQHL